MRIHAYAKPRLMTSAAYEAGVLQSPALLWAYWPPTLQTSSTLVKEPLKSSKSHTVTVEMDTPRRAPVGESVVVEGLELIGFITGAAGKVAAFDVEPVVPLD